MALIIELKIGDSIRVGEAVLTLQQKTGQRVRLEIAAPPTTEIKREPKK